MVKLLNDVFGVRSLRTGKCIEFVVPVEKDIRVPLYALNESSKIAGIDYHR
jgi:hypothetical protein